MFVKQIIPLHQCLHRLKTTITSELLNELCEYCNRVFSRGYTASVAINNILENYCTHGIHGSDVLIWILQRLNNLVNLHTQCSCTYVFLTPIRDHGVMVTVQYSTVETV